MTDQSACKPINNQVVNELDMSDKTVNEDLLRFYTPEGFKPINPNDYQYLGPKGKTNPKQVQTTGE